MRGTWLLVGAILLIAAAWLGDKLIDSLMREGLARFDTAPALTMGLSVFSDLLSARSDMIIWVSAGVALIGALSVARPTPAPPAATSAHAGAA